MKKTISLIRTMIPRQCVLWGTAGLLLATLALASVCPLHNSAESDLERANVVALSIDPNSIESGSFLLENGEVISPGSGEYDAAPYGVSHTEYNLNKKHTVFSTRYEYKLDGRVSSVAYSPVNIGAGVSICCRCFISQPSDWSVKDQKRLMKELGGSLELSQVGYSAITSALCFNTEDKENYSVVLFYPKYLVISGEVSDGDEWIEYEAWFPCLNSLGCMDGMYKVYTSRGLDMIPE